MKRLFISFALSLSAILGINAITPRVLSGVSDREKQERWVDSVYNSMSLNQRVGQIFVPKLNPETVAATKQSIARLVKDYGIGGLLFSRGTISQYATLTDYAQSLSAVPMLMTLDGEWGLAMRVKDTPKFPYNMTLGAIEDPALLYAYGAEVARECRLMGLHVDFAPVLDVNSNPKNPVIGFRSFGEDPVRVGTLGTAFAQGMEQHGVLTTGKHFPGHGDTNVDSHKALPTITHTLSQLDSVDILPFKMYIDSGMSGIMVGHLNVPELDNSGTPSSLSKAIVTGLLKEKLNFEGIVWSDGLAMKGASVHGANNCVSALKAGMDVLLEPLSPLGDIKAVIAAVNSGEIPMSVIEERCKKMLRYKYALGLTSRPAPVSSPSLASRINSPEADAVIRNLTAASVICLDNSQNLLPISDLETRSIAVVNIGEGATNTFAKYCGKYIHVTTYSTTRVLTAAQIAEIKKYDIVIAGVYNDNAASVADLKKLAGCPNLVTAFFMNPYKVAKFAPVKSSAIMLVGENTRYAQEYCAQGIFGGQRVNGILPVNIAGVAEAGRCIGILKTRLGYTSPEAEGIGPSMAVTIDSLVKVGLTTGAFPGCQVLVAKGGDIVFDRSYGYTDRAKTHRVNDSTVYDLASVSKAAGMLPGLMLAYDEGLFDLDDPAYKYIPELKEAGKEDITVRELLLHESGMPAGLNLHRLLIDSASFKGALTTRRPRGENTIRVARNLYANRNARLRRDITSTAKNADFPRPIAHGIYASEAAYDTIMARIHNASRRSNKNYYYSDLNFALLMEMEQNMTGRAHDEYVESEIFKKLGATSTRYNPSLKGSTAKIAPTEKDPFLRKQTVKGYVHDELAAFSGGVQGNAGLFSNANDLAKLCQMWLNRGSYGGKEIMSPETVDLFTTTKSHNSRRGLGFDGPDIIDITKTPTAPEASAMTYGHIGFTGTCFWIDPENDLFYIFLSNRINPSRENAAFSRLNIRPAIMSAIYRAMK